MNRPPKEGIADGMRPRAGISACITPNWIAIAMLVGLSSNWQSVTAQERQVWKMAYRFAENEYDGEDQDWNLVFTAFSPDGDSIAAGYGNGLVRLYKTADGTLRRALRHKTAVRRLQFSKDGQRLMTLTESRDVQLWDPATGHLVAHLGLPKKTTADGEKLASPYEALSAELSPDGKAIVTLGKPGHTVYLWAPDQKGEFSPLEVLTLERGRKFTDAMRFSPDGKTIAAVDPDNVYAFDRASRQITQTDLEKSDVWLRVFPWDEVANVETAAFSPDGKRFCVRTGPKNFSNSNGLMVFDTETWKLSFHWAINGRVHGFSWSPDSRWIAVASAPLISAQKPPVIIDAASGRVIRELDHPALAELERLAVFSVSISRNGRYILGGLPCYYQAVFVGDLIPRGYYIWDVESGHVVGRLEGDAAGARAIFSPDGKHIVNWSSQPAVWKLAE